MWSGVSSRSPRALTCARLASSNRTTPACPSNAARCNAVLPSSVRASASFGSACKSAFTFSVSPTRTASKKSVLLPPLQAAASTWATATKMKVARFVPAANTKQRLLTPTVSFNALSALQPDSDGPRRLFQFKTSLILGEARNIISESVRGMYANSARQRKPESRSPRMQHP